ncbi:response regulator [Sphingomonas lacusdianchii]|uniref:response regulator n=1 Tax=Sphingomonas lacusdianchii TaxID=2917992 RepID=UPI001F58E5B4|nr:response regulator [Sphingomonas sp. JXJ CY 53]
MTNILEQYGPMSIRCATILLVDDEEAIRSILRDYLNDLQYNVIEASNGDEAIAVIDSMVKIDLVITDIIMPGATDGLSLIDYARRANPRTRTIAMSGFAGSYNASVKKADKFMSKPFTFPALEREVNLLIN